MWAQNIYTLDFYFCDLIRKIVPRAGVKPVSLGSAAQLLSHWTTTAGKINEYHQNSQGIPTEHCPIFEVDFTTTQKHAWEDINFQASKLSLLNCLGSLLNTSIKPRASQENATYRAPSNSVSRLCTIVLVIRHFFHVQQDSSYIKIRWFWVLI